MIAKTYRCIAKKSKQPLQTSLLALVVAMSNVGMETAQALVPSPNLSPVGQGFTVTAPDLAYILKQIKIAETHVAAGASADLVNDPYNCQAMVGLGPNQIPSTLISFGLRTVTGQCNNLEPFQAKFGSADQVFPRLTTPVFKSAENVLFDPHFGTKVVGDPTTYDTTDNEAVFDSQPRMISNLIVDQTSANPAAAYVHLNTPRAQGGAPILEPCTSQGVPADCVPVPDFETLFIPNVTTDVGLSPPFNSLFTIFGQFFDHGLDKITNGGSGTVFVPLKADDPLVAGADHIFDTTDDLPPQLRFMALTRGKAVDGVGPDGVLGTPDDTHHETINTDSPFIDQSQTYTSHESHQVFLREYLPDGNGKPVATGKILSTADGGLATWAMIKAQAASLLGLQLVDVDVNNIPAVLADAYGNFIPGPNGFPQYVTATGLVEGDPLANANNGVLAPAYVTRIETAFLNDIAHSAGPGSISAPKPVDDDTVAGGSLDKPVPAGSYDNELLDLHYICGDGRCNENIALIAIHAIFHMEHDRLVDDIKATLVADDVIAKQNDPTKPSLLDDYKNLVAPLTPGAFKYEERIFQAARFVTEMQYQHLVFEEFARKVQPLINPFQAFAFNQTGADPAITAEFAHAVYRFGHSMLNDSIPRIDGNLIHYDIPLLDGFLNPAEFNKGAGAAGHISDRQAVGGIIMGLSDQVGNEIDEFVADTLRNNLLGLPLDLPSLNMARARSEGVPSLNKFRKEVFGLTNDAQLAPYSNWIDFEQNIKHPKSLVNFIAAYGKHPSIVSATTMADKRAVAQAIINGGSGAPTDSADFMFSIHGWADVAGVSQTGLDDVDLWMGGLAEMTNVFGGLLGSTFNYVFEKQLSDLQNNDRFYYLARTPGMNLRAELEGNSFAELVMRNTMSGDPTKSYSHTLKADPFATADCKFELANLAATAQGFLDFGQLVADDLNSECDEEALLIRMPDGTIKYRASNSVDPSGINGQAVYNGTTLADFIYGGNDNDTFWGGLGDDTINGGGGDDIALGGDGDDVITDFAGADVLKGGPGNDAIDAGPGDDILMPGSGKDFTNGGANLNETFASEGDDFAIAGQGIDVVFGDGGDDVEEGGDQPDLLIGDSSSLFFDDHNEPGHDVLIGQGGDDNYDMEGGDDIGISGPGVEKIAGAAGYDWEIGLGDPLPQVMDLALPLLGVPLPINAVRDMYNEVEALSGWKFNDTLYGDSIVPSQVGGAVAGGFIGCNALDADGVARIAGLELLITPTMRVEDPAQIALSAVTNYCGLTAEPGFQPGELTGGVWGQGNILLGGAGSDTIEGRGANDVIDGDKYLNVRLSVRSGGEALDSDGVDIVRDGSGLEIGSTGLMETAAVTGNFGPGATGMTLQQAVFARKVNPGNIVAVREIVLPTTVAPPDCTGAIILPNTTRINCDKAVYSGPLEEYVFTPRPDGSVIVADRADPTAVVAVPVTPAVPRNLDGTDILWNMEQLSFCPVPSTVVPGTCNTNPNAIPAGAPRQIVSIVPVASTLPIFDFLGVVVNTTSVVRNIVVRNTEVANLLVSGVTKTGADAGLFTITGNTCTGASVPQNASCTVSLTFTPTSAGDKGANIAIAHNGQGLVTNVALKGRGTVPNAVLDVEGFDFGDKLVNSSNTTSILLSNTGDGVLSILSNTGDGVLSIPNPTTTGIAVSSSEGGGRFSRASTTCTARLNPGNSCTIVVRFRPTTGGAKTGTLTITDNSGGLPNVQQTVDLKGNATIAAVMDANTVVSTATANNSAQVVRFNVRTNDTPNNGTVTLVQGTVSVVNGGATVVGQPTVNDIGVVTWRITPVVPAGTLAVNAPAARKASKIGTYTVTYQLSSGTAAPVTQTYTLTLIN